MTGPVCILCDRPCGTTRRGTLFCGRCKTPADRVRRWAHRKGVTYQEAAGHFRRPCDECGRSMLDEQPQLLRCSTCRGDTATSTTLPDRDQVAEDWPRCRECGEAVHDMRATFCRPCRQRMHKVWGYASRYGLTYEEARAVYYRPCPMCGTSMHEQRPTAKLCGACRGTPRGKRVLRLVDNYQVTPAEALRLQQVDACASCGDSLPVVFGKHRHVDHDHRTGEVRGVLCHWCNLMLGAAKDQPARLRAGEVYLSSWQQRGNTRRAAWRHRG